MIKLSTKTYNTIVQKKKKKTQVLHLKPPLLSINISVCVSLSVVAY